VWVRGPPSAGRRSRLVGAPHRHTRPRLLQMPQLCTAGLHFPGIPLDWRRLRSEAMLQRTLLGLVVALSLVAIALGDAMLREQHHAELLAAKVLRVKDWFQSAACNGLGLLEAPTITPSPGLPAGQPAAGVWRMDGQACKAVRPVQRSAGMPLAALFGRDHEMPWCNSRLPHAAGLWLLFTNA
jgi:hypothetical protein